MLQVRLGTWCTPVFAFDAAIIANAIIKVKRKRDNCDKILPSTQKRPDARTKSRRAAHVQIDGAGARYAVPRVLTRKGVVEVPQEGRQAATMGDSGESRVGAGNGQSLPYAQCPKSKRGIQRSHGARLYRLPTGRVLLRNRVSKGIDFKTVALELGKSRAKDYFTSKIMIFEYFLQRNAQWKINRPRWGKKNPRLAGRLRSY